MRAPSQPLQIWLPTLAAFGAGHPLHAVLARADRLDDGASGYLDGLAACFPGAGVPLPAGALTREHLAGDVGQARWLAADPAWVQPDMNGVRLLACGQMQLDAAEAQALAASLQPLFEEAGMSLVPTAPDHWHVRLPDDLALPPLAAPAQAMGEDLAQHLPQGPQGKRWRVLLNDIQVTLHQHPVNAQRRARGLSPVNSLWLWGGGVLPAVPAGPWRGVVSDDLLLAALAGRAGVPHRPRTPDNVAAAGAGWLIDLQDLPATDIASHWWPTLQTVFARQPVRLHAANAPQWQWRPWHRWRFWRKRAA